MKSASYKEDQRVALKTVNALRLPTDLDFEQLLSIVEKSVGRPLEVKRAPGLANTPECAETWRTSRRDVILHAPSESRYQELYWICHELGHLLLGHLDVEVPEAVAPALGEVLDLLDPAMLAIQLSRTTSRNSSTPKPPKEFERFELDDGEEIVGGVQRCLLGNPGERLTEAVADNLYMHLHKASRLRLTEPGEFGSIFG